MNTSIAMRGSYLFFVVFILLAFQANAATFTVNTLDNTDDGSCNAGHCSLREAINAANVAPNTDDIVFSVAGTIDLSGGLGILPTISAPVNLTGTNITLSNSAGVGLALDGGAANSSIQGLTITNSTSHGMSVVGAANVTVNNCTLNNNGTTGSPVNNSTGNGFNGENCNNLTFTNNIVQNNQENGVIINNGTSCTINGNMVENSGFHGIIVLGGNNSTFDGNTSNNNGLYQPAATGFPSSAGIAVVNSDGCTFTNNTLNGSTGEAGLFIIASSNCTATGNTTCNNFAAGIWILAGNNNSISNNTSCDNTGNNTPGILISDGSNNNVITNNTITGNQCAGVNVTAGNGNTITDNVMMDNNCEGIQYNGLAAPDICSITASEINLSVTGSGTIHVYEADPDSPCQGMTLVGTFPVNNGSNNISGSFDPSTTYAISFTNSSGTTSPFSCDVNGANPPDIPPQMICVGNSAVLDAGPGWANYIWDTGQQGQTITVTPTQQNTVYTVSLTSAGGCQVSAGTIVTLHPEVTATVTNFNAPLCNGQANGSITIQGGGGDGNFSYQWSPINSNQPTINSLPAGTYNVTVTDGNMCSTSTFVELTDPSPLQLNFFNPITPDCDNMNGQVTASASGGTNLFGYSWSPTGNNSATQGNMEGGQIYTVTAQDGNGCTITDDFTFPAQTPIFIANANVIEPACPGSPTGSIAIIADGGDGNFSYNWVPNGETSDNISGLTEGTYTVEITDGNMCTYTEKFYAQCRRRHDH